MSNPVQIFEDKEFGKLEVLVIDGKPYFPAKECAEILGYNKTRNAVERHCPHALKRGVGVQTGIKADGNPAIQVIEKTYIPEGDLYRLIMRSNLPAAMKFEAWVCNIILPAIRKYGLYVQDDVLQKMQSDKEFTNDLLQRLSEEKEKNRKWEKHYEQMEIKIHYFDAILNAPDTFPVTIIAKEYGMSAVKFNMLLKHLGIQYKVRNTWVLFQDYTDKGYAVIETHHNSNGEPVAMTLRWTQAGRHWLYRKLKKHGILPLAEKML